MQLLSIKDVIAMFGLKNRRTIDNWLYTGTMPRSVTLKVGRNVFFVKEKLEEFIKNTYEKQQEASA